jgi:hypothetical protein
MKMIWVKHDDIVVFAPKPEDICTYLDNSNLWEKYTHPKNPNLNGWKFFREDDMGEEILIPKYSIWEKTENKFKSICKIESVYTGKDSPAFKLAIIKKINNNT